MTTLIKQNTDTKRYWGLTKNIYRFAYLNFGANGLNNVHTVDEFMVSEYSACGTDADS